MVVYQNLICQRPVMLFSVSILLMYKDIYFQEFVILRGSTKNQAVKEKDRDQSLEKKMKC